MALRAEEKWTRAIMIAMPPSGSVTLTEMATKTAPADPSPTGIHLVLGDEEFLVARAVAELKARAQASKCDVSEELAGGLTAGRLAELLSPSLFGEARLVIIRNGQDLSKDLATVLLTWLPDLSDDVAVVVAHAGGAKGKALVDGVRRGGATTVECRRLTKQRERVDFVAAEVKRHGGQCGGDAAAAIVEAVGADLRELSSVSGQLVADTGGRVTVEAVQRYHQGKAAANGFAVADAAIVGDLAGALEALRWALSVGVDPVPIADALADGVRSIARVASAGGRSPYQLAGELGMPPWKIERAARQARGWSADGISAAMQAAARLNAEVKGGAEDRPYALERAVMTIVQARRRE